MHMNYVEPFGLRYKMLKAMELQVLNDVTLG